ncbi:MAG: LamB/YcsF family protein, partial [Actinomycetes bacterium]
EPAAAVVAAVLAYDPALPVLGLPGSVLLRQAAAAGLTAVPEAFADRGYTATGRLVPRTQPGAVLTDPEEVAARTVRLVTTGRISSVAGTDIPAAARSVCVHGDTPGAVTIARAVRSALVDAGVRIRPFAA